MFRRILDRIKPPTGDLLEQLSLCLQCQQYVRGATYALEVPQKKLAREIEYFMRDARSKYHRDKSRGQAERYLRLCTIYSIIFNRLPKGADTDLLKITKLSEDDDYVMTKFRDAMAASMAIKNSQ